MHKSGVLKLIIAAVLVVAAVLGIAGLITGKDLMYHLQNRSKIGPLTREDITVGKTAVETPEPAGDNGIILAEQWGKAYPDILKTMKSTSENSYVTDYLEQDAYLKNIYEGYGFAKDYGSARGHEYTLADVEKTQRPHPLANCLTCKTPGFTKLVNDQGVGVYKWDFTETLKMMQENISCYTCHGNEAGNEGTIEITHSYVHKALDLSAFNSIPASTLTCAQCHIEYYFTPADKETMMPYHDVASMTPEAILAYYDSMDFSDWTQESTGAKLLKAQHPEFETFMQGPHAKEGLTCADCHMPIEMNETGEVYHSHDLVSPIKNATALSTCAECHDEPDMKAFVERIQARVTARETEVGNKLSAFKDALAKAVSEGKLSEEKLDEVRKLYREAQWFFDFCYVENAEGAHNSDLAYRCLDTAEEKINAGMAILSGTN